MFQHACLDTCCFVCLIYMCFVFCICTCSAQLLSIFHVEWCSRNTLLIVVIIIIVITDCCVRVLLTLSAVGR